ncbi:hypothetical protein LC612_39915, partial [Nostoc sp. CHAB 5834]|nr:hypothetical protein [Nostoc sp. CHAB 5834]
MTVRAPTPAKAAQLIQSTFKKAKETEFQLKDAYDLLAQLHGYQSWAAGKQHLEAKSKEPGKPGAIPWATAKEWTNMVFFYANIDESF